MVDLPTRIRANAVISVVKNLSTDYFLDVGAGTGVYSFFLTRNRHCRGLAFDVDESRIDAIQQQARRLGRHNLQVLCASESGLEKLPATFSLVLAIEVLQYFPDLRIVITNLQRRLRPGGTLIAHVPVFDSLRPYEHTLFDDEKLTGLFINAGFDPPQIRQTFGPAALALCKVFTWAVDKPIILAWLYPWLLLALRLTPRFVRKGSYRLVIAHKPEV